MQIIKLLTVEFCSMYPKLYDTSVSFTDDRACILCQPT